LQRSCHSSLPTMVAGLTVWWSGIHQAIKRAQRTVAKRFAHTYRSSCRTARPFRRPLLDWIYFVGRRKSPAHISWCQSAPYPVRSVTLALGTRFRFPRNSISTAYSACVFFSWKSISSLWRAGPTAFAFTPKSGGPRRTPSVLPCRKLPCRA